MTDTIIEKIKKLLALSQDATGNVNETSNAAVAAQRLMLEYKITSAQIESTNGNGAVISWYYQDPGENWRRLLLDGICRTHFCRMIILQNEQRMRLFGKPQDVEVVQFLYKSLTYQIVFASELACRSKKQKESFLQGAVDMIVSRLRASRRQQESEISQECVAIVRVADAQVNDAFRAAYPQTTALDCKKKLDPTAYNQGVREGKKVDLGQKKIDHERKAIG